MMMLTSLYEHTYCSKDDLSVCSHRIVLYSSRSLIFDVFKDFILEVTIVPSNYLGNPVREDVVLPYGKM